jgi:phospholipid/cholesterol/gamma-HCH transport system substrate-binding protein
MHCEILSRYRIYRDALFTIEQAGFLGDQYIAVTPRENTEVLKPGETIRVEEPFNLQEVARTAAGLLRRLDETAATLNTSVARVDQTLLAEATLTNLASAVDNFQIASERALSTLDGVDDLVQTNAHPLSTAISNLVGFSEQLQSVSEELQLTVSTNRHQITAAIRNVQAGTVQLNELLSGIEEGKGLVGSVLRDDTLQQQFASTMENIQTLSSNLSRHGLLWRPRTRPVTTNIVYPGKLPWR